MKQSWKNTAGILALASAFFLFTVEKPFFQTIFQNFLFQKQQFIYFLFGQETLLLIVLLPFFFLKHRVFSLKKFSFFEIILPLLIGVFIGGFFILYVTTEATSLSFMPDFFVAFLSFPILGTLLAWLFFRESFSVTLLVTFGFLLSAAFAFLFPTLSSSSEAFQAWIQKSFLFLMLFAALANFLLAIVKKHLQISSSFRYTFWSTYFSWCCLLTFFLFFKQKECFLFFQNLEHLKYIALSFPFLLLGLFFLFYALKHVSFYFFSWSFLSFLALPSFWNWIFHQHSLPMISKTGGVCLFLVTLFLALWSSLAKKPKTPLPTSFSADQNTLPIQNQSS